MDQYAANQPSEHDRHGARETPPHDEGAQDIVDDANGYHVGREEQRPSAVHRGPAPDDDRDEDDRGPDRKNPKKKREEGEKAGHGNGSARHSDAGKPRL